MRVAGNMRGGRGARPRVGNKMVPWRGGFTNDPAMCERVMRDMRDMRAAIEDACRVTTAAPVLEAVGSTRAARWFRRPQCGPDCGPE